MDQPPKSKWGVPLHFDRIVTKSIPTSNRTLTATGTALTHPPTHPPTPTPTHTKPSVNASETRNTCVQPQSQSQSQSRPPTNNKISVVWRDKNLRKIFLDIISNSQFRLCKYLKSSFFDKMSALVLQNCTDDKIYEEMHHWVHHTLSERNRKDMLHNNTVYRSVNRALKIKELVEKYINTKETVDYSKLNILDVGCAEGSITVMVGRYLQLSPENIHGCDIESRNDKYKDQFQFKHLNNNEPYVLPYDDQTFDVVLALMSLHHIPNRVGMLSEIKRILKPGGLLIIREHNCISKGLEIVLDVVHGFYSMVWSEPKEMNDFNDYYAKYTSSDYLTKLIEKHGYIEKYNNRFNDYPRFYKGKIINPLNYYYAVYEKIA